MSVVWLVNVRRSGADDFVKPVSVFLDELMQASPHSRLPELVDVACYAVNPHTFRLGIEERCDLVCHTNKFVIG